MEGDWEEIDLLIGELHRFVGGQFGLQKVASSMKSASMAADDNSVTYYMDCGRAGVEAVEKLYRLEIAHERFGIDRVIIGEGFLP